MHSTCCSYPGAPIVNFQGEGWHPPRQPAIIKTWPGCPHLQLTKKSLFSPASADTPPAQPRAGVKTVKRQGGDSLFFPSPAEGETPFCQVGRPRRQSPAPTLASPKRSQSQTQRLGTNRGSVESTSDCQGARKTKCCRKDAVPPWPGRPPPRGRAGRVGPAPRID